MTTPTEELRKLLTKLAEEARIAYVRWEKDQSYDGEKVEYDLVEDALGQLQALIHQKQLEAYDEALFDSGYDERQVGPVARELVDRKRQGYRTQLQQLNREIKS